MSFDIANLILNIGQTNPKNWVDILSALLTPTIAIFAGVIAYQQWQTQEKQRKQDLFEKRYDNLYKKTIDIHYEMMNMDLSKIDDKSKFVKLTLEHLENIEKYEFLLKENDVNELQKVTKQWRDHIKEYSKENSEIDIKTYETSNFECVNKIRNILSPYLRIENEHMPSNLWELLGVLMKNIFFFIFPICNKRINNK